MAAGSGSKRFAARATAFVLVALFAFFLLTLGSLAYLLTTGDELVECDYVDCGPTGEFVNDQEPFSSRASPSCRSPPDGPRRAASLRVARTP